MGKLKKLFDKTANNPADVRFADFCKLAEAFGFEHQGGKGSHEIYSRDGIDDMLNLQNVNGKAKAYQVRQFLKLIEDYGLKIMKEK
ncbi:MAG: hypothetical protein C0402_14405 [Thermodesulfovibrio sp.]|nr:hypothetical protein [Thermodesulfovibrio sp.]